MLDFRDFAICLVAVVVAIGAMASGAPWYVVGGLGHVAVLLAAAPK